MSPSLLAIQETMAAVYAIRADIARTVERAALNGCTADPVEIAALTRGHRIAQINARRALRGKALLFSNNEASV